MRDTLDALPMNPNDPNRLRGDVEMFAGGREEHYNPGHAPAVAPVGFANAQIRNGFVPEFHMRKKTWSGTGVEAHRRRHRHGGELINHANDWNDPQRVVDDIRYNPRDLAGN